MSDDLVTRIHLAIAEFDDARVADCAHEAAAEIKRLRVARDEANANATEMSAIVERLRTEALHGMGREQALRQSLAEARDEVTQARGTGQFWKANHLAGNAEIDALKARRCGTCADWGPKQGGAWRTCDQEGAECHEQDPDYLWSANHGCPEWRAK